MFTGCGTALVTPFRQDLSLDESTLRALVEREDAAFARAVEIGDDFSSGQFDKMNFPVALRGGEPASVPADGADELFGVIGFEGQRWRGLPIAGPPDARVVPEREQFFSVR